MFKIQSNASGTRSIDVSENNLDTIRRYHLLRDLIDSNGYVDESVLDKLRLNIRAILEAGTEKDNDLLELCLDVVYHPNMKAFGLQKLVELFSQYCEQNKGQSDQSDQTDAVSD